MLWLAWWKLIGFEYVRLNFCVCIAKFRQKLNWLLKFDGIWLKYFHIWPKLDELKMPSRDFQMWEIEQLVRAILPISEHSGFLGKFFFDRELVYRCLIRFFLFLTATLRNLFQHYISDYQHNSHYLLMYYDCSMYTLIQ